MVHRELERTLPVAGWWTLALWLLGRRRCYRISGASMSPTLVEGERVLVDPRAPPNTGSLVVARHPFQGGLTIAKRVSAIDAEGRLTLVGDNPAESSDSRSFGALHRGALLGVICARLPRPLE